LFSCHTSAIILAGCHQAAVQLGLARRSRKVTYTPTFEPLSVQILNTRSSIPTRLGMTATNLGLTSRANKPLSAVTFEPKVIARGHSRVKVIVQCDLTCAAMVTGVREADRVLDFTADPRVALQKNDNVV